MKPTIPAASITHTSNSDEPVAYEPMRENTKTPGQRIVRGISVTRENTLAPARPMARNMMFATSMAPKIAYTNSGVSFMR